MKTMENNCNAWQNISLVKNKVFSICQELDFPWSLCVKITNQEKISPEWLQRVYHKMWTISNTQKNEDQIKPKALIKKSLYSSGTFQGQMRTDWWGGKRRVGKEQLLIWIILHLMAWVLMMLLLLRFRQYNSKPIVQHFTMKITYLVGKPRPFKGKKGKESAMASEPEDICSKCLTECTREKTHVWWYLWFPDFRQTLIVSIIYDYVQLLLVPGELGHTYKKFWNSYTVYPFWI